MTDRQLRHLDAAINGDKALTNNSGVFGTDAPLMLRQGKLQASIAKCKDYHMGQKRNLGYRAKTVHDLQTMEGRAWAVAKIVGEYARDIGNTVLEHKVDFDRTDFSEGSIQEMKDNASIVFNATNGAVQTAMTTAGYHITPADVAALGTSITDVEADMGGPKADITATKASTEGLKNEIKDHLDPGMDSIVDYIAPYALTNLDEYNTVVDAFEIPEIGKRKISLWVRVSDSVTHTRYSNAVVTVTGPEIADTAGLEKKTSKRGIVARSHEDLPEGNYTVTVSLNGCDTKVFNNVAVFDDRMTTVDCQLVRTV